MTWRTHVLGGVSSLWLIALIPGATGGSAGADNLGLLAAVAALGALLPDLDATDSKLRHLNLGAGVEPFVLPGRAMNRLLGHRGLLHSGWGIALFALLLALPLSLLMGWQPGVALLLGYTSHVALDACTKSGVPLFYPKRRRFWLLPPAFRVVTGGVAESALFVPLALAVLLLLLRTLHQMIGLV